MSRSKILVRIALLISLVCFALALCACGKDFSPNFSGTWRVVSMEESSGADLTPVIEQLNSANKQLVLTLSDDKEKNANFDLAGQTTLTGTWKATSETTCVIAFEGYQEVEATLEDGLLCFDQQGQTMSCQKQE